jgi:hypothetical protein
MLYEFKMFKLNNATKSRITHTYDYDYDYDFFKSLKTKLDNVIVIIFLELSYNQIQFGPSNNSLIVI